MRSFTPWNIRFAIPRGKRAHNSGQPDPARLPDRQRRLWRLEDAERAGAPPKKKKTIFEL